MTPIEQALRKVRELREAEKRINREVMFDHLPDCRAAEYRECTCIAVTSAALRNAAEPLLGLLEALLESLSLSDEDYWEYGGIARQKTEAALAAFVEGLYVAD